MHTSLTVAGLVTVLGTLSLAPTAQAAPAPSIQVQQIGPKATLSETDFGAEAVTFTVRFKCKGAPVGTFLQVETRATQDGESAVGFGSARCTGTNQTITLTALSDPFFNVELVPGTAVATATVYGCPANTDEFCDGFIDERTRTVKLSSN
jgi:hypothetical protein